MLKKMNLCVDCIQKNQLDLETEKSLSDRVDAEVGGEMGEDGGGGPANSTTTPNHRKNSSESTSSSDSFIDLNLEDANLTRIRASGKQKYSN